MISMTPAEIERWVREHKCIHCMPGRCAEDGCRWWRAMRIDLTTTGEAVSRTSFVDAESAARETTGGADLGYAG